MSVETNFGELLLNAAEARPEGVCVETEAAAYTFEQVVFLWLPFAEHFGKPWVGVFRVACRLASSAWTRTPSR